MGIIQVINNHSDLESHDFIDLAQKIANTIAYVIELCDKGIKNQRIVNEVDDNVEIMKMIFNEKYGK